MSLDAAVQVDGLRKLFWDEGRGVVRAVDGIDFVCRPGEVLGLLGANGAVRTTTHRVLAPLLKPPGGCARMTGDHVVQDPEAVCQSLCFVSASTCLCPRLTARETLAFFARVNRYPTERVKERVDTLVERFGI